MVVPISPVGIDNTIWQGQMIVREQGDRSTLNKLKCYNRDHDT